MKIKFHRSGGFANIQVDVELDSATLSKERADNLQQLMNKVLPFKQGKVEVVPDVCSYDFLVEDGEQAHSLKANDLTLSNDMQELIDFLMAD